MSVLDCFIPCGLRGKTSGCVQVANELRLGLQFVDIVDGFGRCRAIWEVLAGRSLDNDGVGVVVTDDGDERDAPQVVGAWLAPSA